MSISEISIVGQVFGRSSSTQSGTAAAEPERQILSPSGKASPPQAQAEQTREQQETPAELTEQAVATVKELLQSQARSLQFEVDDESGMDILTVLDGDTGEVIRRFPADEVIASARYISENLPDAANGLLLDEQG